MATVHFNRTLSGEMVTQFMNAVDAGSTGGTIKFYTSPMPADTTVAITTQTLLGTCTFDTTCGSVAAGTFTADAITPDSSADASDVYKRQRQRLSCLLLLLQQQALS